MPLTTLALLAVALGHPVGGEGRAGGIETTGVVGMRLVVRVDAASVELDLEAEVPARRVYEDARAGGADATFAERYATRLGNQLRASWGGAPIALAPADGIGAPAARAGELEYVTFTARRRGPHPGAPGTLAIENRAFLGEAAYFATTVLVAGDLVATGTSLLRVAGGALRDNRHGAWIRDDRQRTVTVDLRPARPWERAAEATALPSRMQGVLARPSPAWIAGALLPLAAAAIAWRRRRR